MVRKKKEVYHVKPLTEGKKNIISLPGLPIMTRFFFSSMNLQLASSLRNKSDIYSFAKCGDRAADRKQ